MLPTSQTFAEIASHLEESIEFMENGHQDHRMLPIFRGSNLLNVAGDFEGSVCRCIFTVELFVRFFWPQKVLLSF